MNQEFGVACEIEFVEFEPPLPEHIQKTMPIVTLFMLANYSFESASLDDDYLRFEAGFGNENFGSLVQIPLLAIKHIYVGEYPILINVTSPQEEEKEEVDSMSLYSIILKMLNYLKIETKRSYHSSSPLVRI